MNKKQVILTFIKSKFETQLYIISNIKCKSYLINKMVFSPWLSKTQKLPQYQIVFKFNLKMVQGG
jgi:hypothetical protein